MAKSRALVEAEDALKDIYDLVHQSGTTRADMEEALDQISDLCADTVPELGESDESDSGESADEDQDG